MRLCTVILRKSGQVPELGSPPEQVALQSPPVLQALKMTWPSPETPNEPKKSANSLRSLAARTIGAKFVVWVPPVPVEQIIETVTLSASRFEMNKSATKRPLPPTACPPIGRYTSAAPR